MKLLKELVSTRMGGFMISKPISYILAPTPTIPSKFANTPPPPLNGSEEQLLSDLKVAAAIVSLLILIIVLIVALRNCTSSNSSNDNQSNVTGGESAAGIQVTIELPQLCI
ncbi:hypothetical protein FCV25MIE_00245 [Fagus crenata]